MEDEEGKDGKEEAGKGEAHLEKAHNIPHVLLKPHIDHPIRLVHAEVLALVERELAFLEHVLQTTGSGDDHVEPLGEDVLLVGHGDAADAEEGADSVGEGRREGKGEGRKDGERGRGVSRGEKKRQRSGHGRGDCADAKRVGKEGWTGEREEEQERKRETH